MAATFQMLLRGLDGRTSCLHFPSSTISGSLLQERIASILRIPAAALFVVTGTSVINPHTFLCASSDGFFPSCSLLLRLRGGKGGFGSLLRGAATKAGQKKTNNFDACRDMSGRRLRHVNAEKKLKEWKAQAKERELEKAANEFLKKQVKQKEDESGCFQVIEMFREETSRAREDVESAVARGLAEAKKLGKRKVVDESLPSTSSKRAHTLFSSEIDMIEEDSEDEKELSENEDVDAEQDSEEGKEDEDAEEGSEDEDTEKGYEGEDPEKGCEDDNAQQGCQAAKFEGRFVDDKAKVSSEYGKAKERSECKKVEKEHACNGLDNGYVAKCMPVVEVVKCDGDYTSAISVSVDVDLQKQQSGSCGDKIELEPNALPENMGTENGFQSRPTDTSLVSVETDDFVAQSELSLSNYLHASELEVLGLARLKQELQIRGLKCGGSLAERAGRLFLLKTVPLEKLEKKHFARARA